MNYLGLHIRPHRTRTIIYITSFLYLKIAHENSISKIQREPLEQCKCASLIRVSLPGIEPGASNTRGWGTAYTASRYTRGWGTAYTANRCRGAKFLKVNEQQSILQKRFFLHSKIPPPILFLILILLCTLTRIRTYSPRICFSHTESDFSQ